jgi:hypothetical protein
MTAYVLAGGLTVTFAADCAAMAAEGNTIGGGYCTLVPALLGIVVLGCALDPNCLGGALLNADTITRFGSLAASSGEWTLERLTELTDTMMKCQKRFIQCLEENWETHEQLCVDCDIYCNAQAEWPSWKCHPEGEENHGKMTPLVSTSPAFDPSDRVDNPFWLGPCSG